MRVEMDNNLTDHARRPQAAMAPQVGDERLALAAASAATWNWNLETGEITRSEGMAALFGLPAGALDRAFDEHFVHVHPDDRNLITQMDRRHVAEGVPYDVEYRVIRPDGSVRWLREKAEAVRDADGTAVQLHGVTMDVTDRKEAEEALRRSEARWRSLVQHASDVIVVLEPNGAMRYESSSVTRVLGYSPEELVGTDPFSLIHPDDLARAQDLFGEVQREAGGSVTGEVRARHKDGSWRWLEAIGTNLLADPDVGGIVVNYRDVTDRKQAEQALRESEQRLRLLHAAAERQARELALLDQVRSVLARELDPSMLFRTVVEATAATFGYSLVSLYLLEDNELVLQHQVGYERVIERVPIAFGVSGRVVRTGTPELVTDGPGDPDFLMAVEGIKSAVCVPLRDRDHIAGVLILESRGEAVLGEDDLRLMLGLAEHVGVAIGRARLYAEARASEARFSALVQNAPDMITILDAEGVIRYMSPTTLVTLGYGPDELVGENVFAMIHPNDLTRASDLFAACLAKPGASVSVDCRFRHKDGSWRWLEAIGTNLLADPNVGGIVVNSRDSTDRRRAEERLAHLAFHDPLTGLPNRAYFMDTLEGALGRSRSGVDPLAVLLIDLDGFKLVNDSRGHHAGDILLAEVARRLSGSLESGATLARLGGDEFAVLLERIPDAGEAVRAAERLMGALRSAVMLDDGETYVGASIGIAVSTRRRSYPVDLLRSADIALYRAKAAGPGSVAVFEPRMGAQLTERLDRENGLRRALERDELELHYQPKVELATGQIVAAEALVRWAQPGHGLLPSAAFIEVAEATGLIVPIGQWVLREACRTAKEWQDGRFGAAPMICVNLSARQLGNKRLVSDMAQTLDAVGLDPCRLALEITESVAMADAPEMKQTLRVLRDLGVRLVIDDFGAGYSSLSRLRDLAFDALKIDGSFTARLGKDRASFAIVQAVTVLAHDLGLTVTAEGVETAEQTAELLKIGVDLGQGFYFAQPLMAEALNRLLGCRAQRPENSHAPVGLNVELARQLEGRQPR